MGFFTMIAGTAIMASQLVIVVPVGKCAVGLGLFGLALWLFLIYAIFIALIIQTDKPSLSVPHPVFWTQVILKPPSRLSFGRATGL
jgi:hypothetical protein